MMVVMKMTAITMTVTLNDEDNFKMGRGIQQWRLPDQVALLVCCFQVKLRLVKWVFVGEGEIQRACRKPSGRDKNQQQTQPTFDIRSGIQPRPWLVL